MLQFLGQAPRTNDPFKELLDVACTLHKSKEQIQLILSSTSTVELPVINRVKLYVREAYKKLYNHIKASFSSDPLMRDKNRLVITGTSGIGKSAFFVYFITRLLMTSKEPPIVIFHTRDGIWYAFGGTTTLRFGAAEDFQDFLQLPQTWYLVDSPENPKHDIRAKVLYSLSPSLFNSDRGPYHEVHKQSPRRYFMATWSLEELEQCRKYVFETLETDLVQSLYHKIGGIPRYVLQVAERMGGKGKQAEDEAYRHVQEAIDAVGDMWKLLQCISQEQEYLKHSSLLLHRWPKEDKPQESYLKWASHHIQEQLIHKLSEQSFAHTLQQLYPGNKAC